MSKSSSTQSFRVIDSHTGGEPTRTIVEGGPELIGNSMGEKLRWMHSNHDGFRRAIVNEPRGSEVMVGAHLVPPIEADTHCGIVFFNNVGYLGMCGHGTIGVVATLAYLGRIQPGNHRFETVAGMVTATLHHDRSVTIENVPSYRTHAGIDLDVAGVGIIQADVAYGGNWFCLVQEFEQGILDRPIPELLDLTERILVACRRAHPQVDHVELFGKPKNLEANSRNFVLCPGGMYDRSPCGTGTSAKLACLAADGKLVADTPWIQESIIGSCFTGSYHWSNREQGLIAPKINGRAFVNADSLMIVESADPFAWGLETD